MLTTLGKSMWIEICQIHGQDSFSSHLNEKTHKRTFAVRERLTQIQATTRPVYFAAWKRVRHVESGSENGKASVHFLKNLRSIMRGIFSSVRMMESPRTLFKSQGKSWRYRWRRLRLVKMGTKKRSNESRVTDDEIQGSDKIHKRQSMHASQRLMNPRESVWNRLYQEVMKITWQRGFISMSHYNLVHKIIPICLKVWKFRMWKEQQMKNGRRSKSSQRGDWTRSWAKIMSSWKHNERKIKSTLLHWGHLSSQKCGVGTEVSKVQLLGRAPRWHCDTRFRILCCIQRTKLRLFDCAGQAADTVSTHSSKIGGRFNVAKDSKVRMSRFWDASSTTRMAQIMVKHWGSSGLLERNLYGHTLAGFLWERHFEKVLLWLGW